MPRRPSRFDDQPAWLDAKSAVALLGVKRDTLYAYVSRGLVRRVGERGHHRYAREDLERLRARSEARAGHGPVAAGALNWGEPVLATAVSSITPRGPLYRGVTLDELRAKGARFEQVARLLVTGENADNLCDFPAQIIPTRRAGRVLDAFASALASRLGDVDEDPSQTTVRAWATAQQCISALAATLAAQLGAPAGSLRSGSLAWGLCGRDEARARGLDRALSIVAEHELNPSTFAARVAASAGAGLTASLLAAVATMRGVRHGGASDALEALLFDAPDEAALVASLHRAARDGAMVPGFGHVLYPDGDPRARWLLEDARALAPRSAAWRRVELALETLASRGHAAPNVDAGLVALRVALELPRGSAAGVFALGRSAGWAAHALEQSREPTPLRPRAQLPGA